MVPLKIIFAGSGEFAVPTLRALVQSGHQLLRVVTQPDKPAGRGRVLTPTATAQAALALGVEVVRTDNINELAEIFLQMSSADVLVVIAFGQKISEQITHAPRLGSVNLHASRLPKYRGAAPINAAIIGGETITGNSVIRLAQKMDAGTILDQSEVLIGELETAGELHDRLAIDGAPLMLRVLESLANKTSTPTEQNHAGATLARKLSREAARIDWKKPADTIAREIRGMYPWPGCRVQILDGENVTDTVTLVRAKASMSQTSGKCGDLTSFGVIAGDGRAVDIAEVQPAGKRAMPLAAYARGHAWKAGMRVRSI